ncbi:hypothetical protein Aca07nite_64590 [Actinoplanes capillaceus]|uniref:Uncharacterized protein n=1 Tax=Actinoplanes campanulatus TaxID=113559 RepID=A0ABQ3WSM8_9ACTN|nr:hypothetical protein [Actinoplanes capillaceus]GID49184.1 hypothetical protein Aca07nite_64590 [Actinoplanes capillaceus]
MTNDRKPGNGPKPGVPRWVKVIGIVVVVLAALLIIAQVTGIAGEHGPGRHLGLAPASPMTTDSPHGGHL